MGSMSRGVAVPSKAPARVDGPGRTVPEGLQAPVGASRIFSIQSSATPPRPRHPHHRHGTGTGTEHEDHVSDRTPSPGQAAAAQGGAGGGMRRRGADLVLLLVEPEDQAAARAPQLHPVGKVCTGPPPPEPSIDA
ncbi:hypothetical protein PAPYR_12329 [Paratrimastix pyriformis]|uniref:Uncharacterized protein n=1 Tax=Paratrimastix pyriformis TaxID=342808 RepID=A0ABQ8U215_9EUKA|nr:hypothetical protein PAPYR_12329 [Paratrimastix pyriformis]